MGSNNDDVVFDPPKVKSKAMTKEELKRLFARHTPTPDQLEVMQELRKTFYHAAGLILVNTVPSAEQTQAIRLCHEALMYANLAVVLNDDVF